MKPVVYKNGDGYILVTGESPKEFKDYLFVVWEGPIDGLTEGVKTRDELKKLERADEVPDKWIDAFADAADVCLDALYRHDPEPEPEAPVRRVRKATAAPRDDQMDEFVMHCAVGTDPITAAVASGVFDNEHETECNFNPGVFWACVLFSAVVYVVVRLVA